MNIQTKHISAIAALGLITAALGATSGMASASNGSGTCGVVTSTQNGMLLIQGAVLSPVALNGSYQFSVQSSGGGGNSNISQGGDFTAAANQQTQLGQVMINAGSNYKVVLDVTANGQKLDCEQDLASLR
jgi:hypothetical protein